MRRMGIAQDGRDRVHPRGKQDILAVFISSSSSTLHYDDSFLFDWETCRWHFTSPNSQRGHHEKNI